MAVPITFAPFAFLKPRSVPRKRRRFILHAFLLVLTFFAASGIGTAFAAWLSTGQGSLNIAVGSVVTSSVSASVSPNSSVNASYYPSETGTAYIFVNNPNPYPVVVTSIGAGSSTAVSNSSGTVLCAAGSVTTPAVNGTLAATNNNSGGNNAIAQINGTTDIAPGQDGNYQVPYTASTSMLNTCQGQSGINIPFQIGLASDG